MKITEIEAAQNQTFQKTNSSPLPPQNLKKYGNQVKGNESSNSDPVILKTQGGNQAIRKLEKLNAVMNTVAKSIRTADDAMDEINTTLRNMKSELAAIIKQFPPYPPGSEERVKSLKTFSALRKQIDALSFPPDEGARAILSGKNDETGNETGHHVDFGTEDISVSMKRQAVHPGPDGLDIPDLQENADDEALENAITHIDRAFQTLAHRKNNLAKDVERFIRL